MKTNVTITTGTTEDEHEAFGGESSQTNPHTAIDGRAVPPHQC